MRRSSVGVWGPLQDSAADVTLILNGNDFVETTGKALMMVMIFGGLVCAHLERHIVYG